MNENLTSKVNRLISGSLNSFIGTLEKMAPEMVMEEAIREVDSAVSEVRVELGRIIAKKHLAQVRLTEENHQHKSLSDQISIALNRQREDLAEAAISKQLALETNKLVLESTLENCTQQEQELQVYLLALEEKKQSMSDELSRLILSQQRQGRYQYKQQVTVEGCINNAESTFNRLLEKQTGFVCASDLASRSKTIQLSQLDKLSKQDAIQKRLEQLKAQKE